MLSFFSQSQNKQEEKKIDDEVLERFINSNVKLISWGEREKNKFIYSYYILYILYVNISGRRTQTHFGLGNDYSPEQSISGLSVLWAAEEWYHHMGE